MLTRSQVAARLGKSVATVRRLERAGELNPRRTWSGVHDFDEYEVARLADRYRRGESIAAASEVSFLPTRARSRGMRARHGGVAAETAELQRENADLRQRLSLASAALEVLLEDGPVEEALEALVAALDVVDPP